MAIPKLKRSQAKKLYKLIGYDAVEFGIMLQATSPDGEIYFIGNRMMLKLSASAAKVFHNLSVVERLAAFLSKKRRKDWQYEAVPVSRVLRESVDCDPHPIDVAEADRFLSELGFSILSITDAIASLKELKESLQTYTPEDDLTVIVLRNSHDGRGSDEMRRVGKEIADAADRLGGVNEDYLYNEFPPFARVYRFPSPENAEEFKSQVWQLRGEIKISFAEPEDLEYLKSVF